MDPGTGSCDGRCPNPCLTHPLPTPAGFRDCPPTPVTIEGLNIEELDVTATGMVAVRRCTATCEPIDILFIADENHAGGQGVTTDTGTITVTTVGWVDATGLFTPGAPPTVVPCETCGPPPPLCVPTISSATATTAATLTQIEQLDIVNQTCCAAQIVTSIGTFEVPAGLGHSFKVDCPFDVLSATVLDPSGAGCDPDAVTMTGVKTH
jgi:hypothetical protein